MLMIFIFILTSHVMTSTTFTRSSYCLNLQKHLATYLFTPTSPTAVCQMNVVPGLADYHSISSSTCCEREPFTISGIITFCLVTIYTYHTTTTVLRPFFQDHSSEPVPEENFWTLWCKGRLTEADTPTIWLGATLSGLTSAHLHQPAIFLTGRMPFLPPNQQCQSTEGNIYTYKYGFIFYKWCA